MTAGQATESERSAEYAEYLASDAWQDLRLEALRRDGHACRICNSSKRLDVHHRTYERFGNELLEDLTTLCRKCHRIFHDAGVLVGGRWTKPSKKRPRTQRRAVHQLRRPDVRKVACPTCGASAGAQCLNGAGASRKRCHQARWEEAADKAAAAMETAIRG